MNADAEQRIRTAALAFADELVAVLSASDATDGPAELLDASAACQRLGGIARSTLYSLTAGGTLRSVSVGRRRFWPSTYLAEYIAAQSAPGDSK